MKVVVFIHNHSESDATYSGGRYHALLQAGSMARAGAQVTVVVDSMPMVAWDLDLTLKGSVDYLISPDYAVSSLAADVVLVSPTGAFHPAFYEAAIRVARSAAALLVLVNFESANWFNAVAPVPDDPRVWDYWRRIVADGGVILSSTKLSSSYARSFYHCNQGRLEFIQSYPPVNTEEIRHCRPLPRNSRQQLVYFARPFTRHKGAKDILAMPDAVFAGADLHVISGGPATEPFYAELVARMASVPSASVTVHAEVSERFKFSLLLAADVLLFPSRFEGYGYPPLEAAYCGAEVVAYRLPVLAETVGSVANLVPVGDLETFAAAVVTARERTHRRQWLRDTASSIADYGKVGRQLVREFARLRSGGTLTDHAQTTDEQYSVHWAPFGVISQLTPRRDDPPVPPVASIAKSMTDGALSLTITLWIRTPPALATLSADGVQIPGRNIVAKSRLGPWQSYQIRFNVPRSMLGASLALRTTDAAGATASEEEQLRIVKHQDRDDQNPVITTDNGDLLWRRTRSGGRQSSSTSQSTATFAANIAIMHRA